MAVDYMTVCRIQIKFGKNATADFFIVRQSVIPSFLLLLRLFVIKQIALECGHTALVKRRRIWTAPQIPHKVHRVLFTRMVVVHTAAGKLYQTVQAVEQRAAGETFAGYKHRPERTVLAQRYRSMIQQVIVTRQIERTMVQHAAYVAAQLLAPDKRCVQMPYYICLFLRKFVRIGRIDGWEMFVFELQLSSVDRHSAFFKIYQMQQIA